MQIELNPWTTPNYISAKMPTGKREDGPDFDEPTWKLADVDAETLSEQCNRFRAEVFAKANKTDPYKLTTITC